MDNFLWLIYPVLILIFIDLLSASWVLIRNTWKDFYELVWKSKRVWYFPASNMERSTSYLMLESLLSITFSQYTIKLLLLVYCLFCFLFVFSSSNSIQTVECWDDELQRDILVITYIRNHQSTIKKGFSWAEHQMKIFTIFFWMLRLGKSPFCVFSNSWNR